MHSWGKLWTTRYKKTKKSPTATSEELRATTGCQEKTQSTAHAPCTQHHQRGGQTTQHTPLAQPLDTPLPSPHMWNQLTPHQGARKETCYLFSLPPAAAGAPIKPCPNFLSGLLSISID